MISSKVTSAKNISKNRTSLEKYKSLINNVEFRVMDLSSLYIFGVMINELRAVAV